MAIQHPQSEARIAAMFDRVAPRYDLLNRLLSARQDQRWRRHLVQLVPHTPGGCHLDVATGTGDVLLAVAKARPKLGRFIGVDISREMLERAKTKAREQGLGDRLVFDLQSAEELGVPRDSVDSLSISFGLRNVVNRGRALTEFHRVLKPKGTLLILEFFIPKTGLLASLFQVYFHHILPLIGGLLSDRAAYTYLPQSVGSFYSPDEMREALIRTGFRVVGFKNFMFGSCRLVHAVKN